VTRRITGSLRAGSRGPADARQPTGAIPSAPFLPGRMKM
jgi:hypothetical protein